MYAKRDFAGLVSILPTVVERAKELQGQLMVPRTPERVRVSEIIDDFLRSRKRIVYGGRALHAHLKNAGSSELFYGDDPSDNDIEFYSYRAMDDVVELCKALHKEGVPHVEAKLALHDDTYTINANYRKYCDVTYMPRNLYDCVPRLEIEGIAYVHPHFALIDYVRMLGDPIMSHFRLQKGLYRIDVLSRTFPMSPPSPDAPRQVASARDADVVAFLSRDPRVAFAGSVAYEAYCEAAGRVPLETRMSRVVEFYASDFKDVVSSLLDHLADKDVRYQEHHRFFDFWGRRGFIFCGERLIAVAYDARHRAIPCIEHSGRLIVAFPVALAHAMIFKAWSDVQGESSADAVEVVRDLVDMRKAHSDATEGRGMFEGPFREFVLDRFLGTPVHPMHIKHERNRERERRKRPVVYKYRPTQKDQDFLREFSFDNTSGNAVRGERDAIVRPRKKENIGLSQDPHDVDCDPDPRCGDGGSPVVAA
jgi:hypothetical protein